MEQVFIEAQSFERIDYTESGLAKGEYENCIFTNCDFGHTDLSGIIFTDCTFDSCNLSMVKTSKTTLRGIKFKDCKLMGLHFETCNPFLLTVRFENCVLNYSSFYQVNLKKTIFKNCSLQEVDFTETNLTGSVFENCTMQMARFENSILENADFLTAYNYSIDPEMNRIRKAKFSREGIAGLLDKYDIEIE